LLMIWLLPNLLRGIKRILQFFINLFSGKSDNSTNTNLPASK
jgi:hypothetical protein